MSPLKEVPRSYELGEVNELPLAPMTRIALGAAVGDNSSGCARELVAGDKFLGFCESAACNIPYEGSDHQRIDTHVRLLSAGRVQLAVKGLKSSSLGATVYASEADSFTLTAASNSPMGTVYRVVNNEQAIVAFGYYARQTVQGEK